MPQETRHQGLQDPVSHGVKSALPLYYSGDLIGSTEDRPALTGGAAVDFDKALISLSLRMQESRKLYALAFRLPAPQGMELAGGTPSGSHQQIKQIKQTDADYPWAG
ncbi:hypothetical protein EYF80_015328 [Liparis tanakae]|uniref:Uncharacterized protein n=1 Tax=Liparis tanakae TaxID=230148 RepID=A0A4Z2I9A2_9TELE|nr:hypothetical protein EYF80_015328 [Liparis tanakae]